MDCRRFHYSAIRDVRWIDAMDLPREKAHEANESIGIACEVSVMQRRKAAIESPVRSLHPRTWRSESRTGRDRETPAFTASLCPPGKNTSLVKTPPNQQRRPMQRVSLSL